MMMDGYGSDSWGAGGWVLMALLMLGFWSVVVFGVIAVIRSLQDNPRDRSYPSRPPPTAPPESDAERLLAERFARGEIDAEEFTARRDLLRSGH
jgi:putative membrane protein